MDALLAIENRMSIRSYKTRQVNGEYLQRIIWAGQTSAGSGNNHFSVVQNRELLDAISEDVRLDMLTRNEFYRSQAELPGYTALYHAPTLIVVSSPELDKHKSANAALAAGNIMIAATALGYGSCYLGGIAPVMKREGKYFDAVGIPKHYVFSCGVLVGITDDPAAFSPVPRPKKRTDNVTFVK